MFTDRDFYRSVLTGALESFGSGTLAVILNVPAAQLSRWAQGRTRPPASLVLQVIDLMWPKDSPGRARELGCEGFFDLTAGDPPESFARRCRRPGNVDMALFYFASSEASWAASCN